MNKVILTLSYEGLEKILNLPQGMKIVAAQDHIDTNCVKLKVMCESDFLGPEEQMTFDENTREWKKIKTKEEIMGDFYERLKTENFVV